MIKLKDLLNESSPGFENRKFGDPLPTIFDIQKKHQGLKEETLEEGPDNDLYKEFNKINNVIFKIINKYEKKADVDKALSTWMMGLHANLKKAGYKI